MVLHRGAHDGDTECVFSSHGIYDVNKDGVRVVGVSVTSHNAQPAGQNLDGLRTE